MVNKAELFVCLLLTTFMVIVKGNTNSTSANKISNSASIIHPSTLIPLNASRIGKAIFLNPELKREGRKNQDEEGDTKKEENREDKQEEKEREEKEREEKEREEKEHGEKDQEENEHKDDKNEENKHKDDKHEENEHEDKEKDDTTKQPDKLRDETDETTPDGSLPTEWTGDNTDLSDASTPSKAITDSTDDIDIDETSSEEVSSTEEGAKEGAECFKPVLAYVLLLPLCITMKVRLLW